MRHVHAQVHTHTRIQRERERERAQESAHNDLIDKYNALLYMHIHRM